MAASKPWLAAIFAALAFATADPTVAGQIRCDRAVSHFHSTRGGYEWRVFDPASGTDDNFLHVADVPSQVTWDTTLRFVRYRIGRDIFSAEWRHGSQAHRVARLPERQEECCWWFHPATARFQHYVIDDTPAVAEPWSAVQLWEASENGLDWHFVRRDTAELDEDECTPITQNDRAVSSEGLVPNLGPFAGTQLPAGSDPTAFHRFRLIFDDAPGVIEMGGESGAPEADYCLPPLIYVDESRHIRRTLCHCINPDCHTLERIEVAESCGWLLYSCMSAPAHLLELGSGRDITLGHAALWSPAFRRR